MADWAERGQESWGGQIEERIGVDHALVLQTFFKDYEGQQSLVGV